MCCLRRFLRFSLRSYFSVLFGVSLLVGWISMQVGATLREAKLVAELSQMIGPLEEIGGPLSP